MISKILKWFCFKRKVIEPKTIVSGASSAEAFPSDVPHVLAFVKFTGTVLTEKHCSVCLIVLSVFHPGWLFHRLIETLLKSARSLKTCGP